MARIGTGIRPELGRIDYTPYMQGSVAGAQSIGRGIAGLGEALGQGINRYFDEKEKEAQLMSSIDDLISKRRESKTVDNFINTYITDPAKQNDREALKSAVIGQYGGDKQRATIALREGVRQAVAQDLSNTRVGSLVDAVRKGEDAFAIGKQLNASITEINAAANIVRDENRMRLENDRILAETDRLKADAERMRRGEPAPAMTTDQRRYNAAVQAWRNMNSGKEPTAANLPEIEMISANLANLAPGTTLNFGPSAQAAGAPQAPSGPFAGGLTSTATDLLGRQAPQPVQTPAIAQPSRISMSVVPLPGSEADRKQQEAAKKDAEIAEKLVQKKQSEAQDALKVLTTINEAKALLTSKSFVPGLGGAGGPIEGRFPAFTSLATYGIRTENESLKRKFDQLLGDQTLKKLLDLRLQNPTGGSVVGNASDTDVKMIRSSVSQLDVVANESENLSELAKMEEALLRLMGPEFADQYAALQEAERLKRQGRRGSGMSDMQPVAVPNANIMSLGSSLTDKYVPRR